MSFMVLLRPLSSWRHYRQVKKQLAKIAVGGTGCAPPDGGEGAGWSIVRHSSQR